jgi:hypothetical protein
MITIASKKFSAAILFASTAQIVILFNPVILSKYISVSFFLDRITGFTGCKAAQTMYPP